MATGAVQYVWTGASYDTEIGIVTGGEWGDDTNAKAIAGIGGVGVWVPGAQTTVATFDVVPVDNNCLLDKILRASNPAGLPAAITLGIGDDDDARKGTDWYINTADVDLSVEEALSVSYEVLLPAKPTGTAVSGTFSPAETPLLWLEGYVHLDGADCECRSAKIKFDNGMMARHSLNSKADGSRRHPDGKDSGAEKVEATLELYDPTGDDLLQDDLNTGTVLVVAKNQATTATTWTFTGANGKLVSAKSSLVDGDSRRMWSVRYVWDYNAVVTSVLS